MMEYEKRPIKKLTTDKLVIIQKGIAFLNLAGVNITSFEKKLSLTIRDLKLSEEGVLSFVICTLALEREIQESILRRFGRFPDIEIQVTLKPVEPSFTAMLVDYETIEQRITEEMTRRAAMRIDWTFVDRDNEVNITTGEA